MGEAVELVAATNTPPTAATAEPTVIAEQMSTDGEAVEKVVTLDVLPPADDQKKDIDANERDLSLPSSGEEAAPVPFGEESYCVKDLKEHEKKALQDLKMKIEEAIKNNTFFSPSKPTVASVSREMEMQNGEQQEGEDKKADEQEKKAQAKEETVLSEVVKGGEDLPPSSLSETSAVVVDEELSASVRDSSTQLSEKKECPKPSESQDLPASTEQQSTPHPDPLPEDETKVVDFPSREMQPEECDSPCLEDLSLWGVPLLHSKGDERTDVILLKFLRARDFKVGDAMNMLKDTVTWRKEFEADVLVDEDITTEYESVAFMHHVDKEGHPVCYNHYGVFQDKELYQKTFGDEAQFRKFLRWRIQLLEKGIRELDFNPNGVHSMLQITDLKDSPGFVKRRHITKKILSLLQDNYPELVAKQIFINVPWYFGALYSLHGKIITPRSKSKVVVARPDKVTETLFKYISPENVPLKYGGFSRPSDTEFEHVKAPVHEVMVKAGEKKTIELPVEEIGARLVWDVTVVGWDVVYGEEFIPSSENAYTVIIQKSKRMSPAEEPLRNSFHVPEAGKVVLTVENTSRRKKMIVYRHILKQEKPSKCSCC
ncbi:hypothetical protein KP509_30G034100 [Ceratopteris richardii]|uniref:CRAL-TRIO domain-containing protein n=1 Tax=Ceratopteris richardii TaxID=49495 RepID=A0A8T2R192_CERRI|nr:hypothetical protein KP509_30G034100 [Ceratopteris richardii]